MSMIENFENNSHESVEKKLRDSIISDTSNYIREIEEIRGNSRNPAGSFEELIKSIKEEGSLCQKTTENIFISVHKEIDEINSRIKEEVKKLEKELSEINFRYEEALRMQSGEKPVVSLSGEHDEKLKIIKKKILRYLENRADSELEKIFKDINEANDDSKIHMYQAIKEEEDKIAFRYREFLSEMKKHIGEQIEKEKKDNTAILVYDKAWDMVSEFVHIFRKDCENIVREAKDVLKQEAENN